MENKFTVKDDHLVLSESKTSFSFKDMKFHLENLLKGSPIGMYKYLRIPIYNLHPRVVCKLGEFMPENIFSTYSCY